MGDGQDCFIFGDAGVEVGVGVLVGLHQGLREIHFAFRLMSRKDGLAAMALLATRVASQLPLLGIPFFTLFPRRGCPL